MHSARLAPWRLPACGDEPRAVLSVQQANGAAPGAPSALVAALTSRPSSASLRVAASFHIGFTHYPQPSTASHEAQP